MSFYTSLSGLKAAQTDLSVTANNVANVGTTGFKRSDTQFGDIISSSPLQSSAIPGQGTHLKGIDQQFTQGGFTTSERSLDLAISGQGFFVTRTGVTNGSISYTRNGSFKVDANRYVVDDAGNYVQILPTDANGTVTAAGIESTQNLQVPLSSGQSRATANVDLSVNLPSSADLPAARSVYTGNGSTYAFDRYDSNSFNQQAATTVYDVDGNALPATIYYTRVTTPTTTDPTSTWQARLFVGDTEVSADGNASTTPPAPLTMTFDTNGNLTSPTASVSYASVQPTGASAAMQIDVDYGASTRQTASTFSVKSLTQDGYSAGQLDNVTVAADGAVTASFSNGTSQVLGKIVIANFTNPEGLRQLGDGRWAATGASGDPTVGTAGTDGFGNIQSGSLEQSNVDITNELVELINAQRNFSANAKAIDTANQMTQTIVQLRS